MQRFNNKTVVVTGGSRGIGLGIAERFASEGASILLSSNEKSVNESAERLSEEYSGKVVGHVTDVTDRAQVVEMFNVAERSFDSIDIGVFNAGIITIARLEDMTEDEWDRTLEVNTKGVFLCCQEAASRMRRTGRGGRLINAASGQARQGFKYTPHYAASKFGVVGLTQSLARELAPEDITVNSFCPGIIETDMWAYNDQAWGRLLGDYRPGELMAEWVQGVPMGRVGQASDVAGLVTFLASEDASYITGQAINVDGGLIMS